MNLSDAEKKHATEIDDRKKNPGDLKPCTKPHVAETHRDDKDDEACDEGTK